VIETTTGRADVIETLNPLLEANDMEIATGMIDMEGTVVVIVIGIAVAIVTGVVGTEIAEALTVTTETVAHKMTVGDEVYSSESLKCC